MCKRYFLEPWSKNFGHIYTYDSFNTFIDFLKLELSISEYLRFTFVVIEENDFNSIAISKQGIDAFHTKARATLL